MIIHRQPFRPRVKSHLPTAGIIRNSPYSPRQQNKGKYPALNTSACFNNNQFNDYTSLAIQTPNEISPANCLHYKLLTIYSTLAEQQALNKLACFNSTLFNDYNAFAILTRDKIPPANSWHYQQLTIFPTLAE